MSEFAKKIVVITGGNKGIGAACAHAFAGTGAQVIAIARSISTPSPGTPAGGEQGRTGEGRGGGKNELPVASCQLPANPHPNPPPAHQGREKEIYDGIQFDFATSSAERINDLVQGILEKYGRIDVLVNNAGIIRRAPAIDFSEKDWQEVLQVNLTAPFFLTQAVARWWIERGSKESPENHRLKIINIASLLSFQGGITVSAYAASKHGIAGITKALANEWASQRININAVAPGYIATDNTQALRDNAVRNKAILERIPQGHWGQANEIAGTVMFLASPQANYINGAILNVDGGWLGR